MNAKRTMICVLLAALLLFALAACTPSEQDKPGEKTVSEIAVKTLPDTVEYFVGDEFSVAGGVITTVTLKVVFLSPYLTVTVFSPTREVFGAVISTPASVMATSSVVSSE